MKKKKLYIRMHPMLLSRVLGLLKLLECIFLSRAFISSFDCFYIQKIHTKFFLIIRYKKKVRIKYCSNDDDCDVVWSFIEHPGCTDAVGTLGGLSAGSSDLMIDGDEDSEQVSDSDLLFRCRICWKGFKHPISLTLHKDLHTGQTRCPICQRIFSRAYDMRVHLLRIHKRLLNSESTNNSNKTTNEKSNVKNNHKH